MAKSREVTTPRRRGRPPGSKNHKPPQRVARKRTRVTAKTVRGLTAAMFLQGLRAVPQEWTVKQLVSSLEVLDSLGEVLEG